MSTENYDLLYMLAKRDVDVLIEKGKNYGDSWRRRGGVGAFMMLARKWDRVENMVTAKGYDVFDCELDGVLEDIADLRRYLLLVEGHMIERATKGHNAEGGPMPTTTNVCIRSISQCDHLFADGKCAKCGVPIQTRASQDWENGDSYAPS